MRNSIPLLFALMAVVILGGNYWYQQLNCCARSAAVPVETTPPPVEETSYLNLRDGDFRYTLNNSLPFAKSSAQPSSPVADQWTALWPAATTYLGANANRTVLLTGYYYADEENNSIYPNLGIARANAVKALMIDAGAPAAQIEAAGELLEGSAATVIADGMSVGFKATERNDDRLAGILERLQANPITLYFATNANNLNLSAEQRQDFADLNYYLGRVADAQVAISGHTDNQGDRDYNVNLSLERANFARTYLVRNGLSAARIETAGEGPDRPVAENTTEDGRALNRRVEITLR